MNAVVIADAIAVIIATVACNTATTADVTAAFIATITITKQQRQPFYNAVFACVAAAAADVDAAVAVG